MAKLRATGFTPRRPEPLYARTVRLVAQEAAKRAAALPGITPTAWREELFIVLQDELANGLTFFSAGQPLPHALCAREVREAFARLAPVWRGLKKATWPEGGKARVQINALWGTRCAGCLPQGNDGCHACWPYADAINRLGTTDRASLQQLHVAAEGGDVVGLLVLWDWHLDFLNLARPGSGKDLGLPEAGLWFPGMELEDGAP